MTPEADPVPSRTHEVSRCKNCDEEIRRIAKTWWHTISGLDVCEHPSIDAVVRARLRVVRGQL